MFKMYEYFGNSLLRLYLIEEFICKLPKAGEKRFTQPFLKEFIKGEYSEACLKYFIG